MKRTILTIVAALLIGLSAQGQELTDAISVKTNYDEMIIIDEGHRFILILEEHNDFGIGSKNVLVEMPNNETRIYPSVLRGNKVYFTSGKYSDLFDVFLMYGQYTVTVTNEDAKSYNVKFFLD